MILLKLFVSSLFLISNYEAMACMKATDAMKADAYSLKATVAFMAGFLLLAWM
jgi:hypothetical protein